MYWSLCLILIMYVEKFKQRVLTYALKIIIIGRFGEIYGQFIHFLPNKRTNGILLHHTTSDVFYCFK